MELATGTPDAVPAPLRSGGRGQGADGASLIWSVAEGRKGWRWREVRNIGGGVASSLLLETDADGRFAHLELATPSGLLTLHPERDETLHGHAVVSDGVEHVAGLAWDADGIVLLDGSTVCRVAAAQALAGLVEAGTSQAHLAVVIPATLWLEVKPVRIERLDQKTWRFGAEEPLAIDDRGRPVLRGGETWPLEQGEEPAGPVERHR